MTTTVWTHYEMATGSTGLDGAAYNLRGGCHMLESFMHDPNAEVYDEDGDTTDARCQSVRTDLPPATAGGGPAAADGATAAAPEATVIAHTLQVLKPVSSTFMVSWDNDVVHKVTRTRAVASVVDEVDVRLSFSEYRLLRGIVEGWSRLELSAPASTSPEAGRDEEGEDGGTSASGMDAVLSPVSGSSASTPAAFATPQVSPPPVPQRRTTATDSSAHNAATAEGVEYYMVNPPGNPCGMRLARVGSYVVVVEAVACDLVPTESVVRRHMHVAVCCGWCAHLCCPPTTDAAATWRPTNRHQRDATGPSMGR